MTFCISRFQAEAMATRAAARTRGEAPAMVNLLTALPSTGSSINSINNSINSGRYSLIPFYSDKIILIVEYSQQWQQQQWQQHHQQHPPPNAAAPQGAGGWNQNSSDASQVKLSGFIYPTA